MASFFGDSSLSCTICYKLYTDPRVLPCLHTYCLKCIKGLPVDDSDVRFPHITCPQCKNKHEVHYKINVTDTTYPVDISISPKAAEVKEQLKQCGFCFTPTPTVQLGYCVQCEDYLCKACRDDVHKKVPKFSKHTVTEIDYSSLSIQTPCCFRHPKYKLEKYCKNCVSLICCKCAKDPSHKLHQSELIENAQVEIKRQVDTMIKSHNSKEATFKAYLDLVSKIEKVTITHHDQLRKQIKDFNEKLEAKLTEDYEKISSAKNNLETLLSHIDSSRRFSFLSQSEVSKGESLLLVNQVLQCLVKINNTDMTKPMEDVWSIDSTTADFRDQINDILDLDKLLRICSGSVEKEIPIIKSSNIGSEITGSLNDKNKTRQISFIESGTNRYININLLQPFAKCTEWTCTETTSDLYIKSRFTITTTSTSDWQIQAILEGPVPPPPSQRLPSQPPPSQPPPSQRLPSQPPPPQLMPSQRWPSQPPPPQPMPSQRWPSQPPPPQPMPSRQLPSRLLVSIHNSSSSLPPKLYQPLNSTFTFKLTPKNDPRASITFNIEIPA